MHAIYYSWLFYFMAAHLAILIFLCAKNFKYLSQSVRGIDKKIWLLLFLIFIFSFSLRNSEYWLGPFSDGYVAQDSARMWVLHGDYVKSCALGTPIDCKIPEQVLFPPGFPFLIVIAHLIFGIHSLNASIISAILSSLTTILVFLIAFLIFKRENAGLYAALIYSFIPLNIIYSQTGETRPTGLFFEGLSILLFLLAIRNNRIVTWLSVAASVSYAIYVRQESYILAVILLVFLVIFKWKEIKDIAVFAMDKYINHRKIFFDRRLIATAYIFTFFLILQYSVLRWLLFNNPYQSFQGGGFFALHYRGIMIQGKALFFQFFNMPDGVVSSSIFHYNVVSTVFVLFTAVIFILTPRKKYIFIFSVLLGYFLIYSLMFDGNIQGTGLLTMDYFRRATMFHVPYAVMGGLGFCLLSPFKKRGYVVVNLLLLFSILLFSNYSYFHKQYSGVTPVSFYFPMKIFQDARATRSGDWSLIRPATDVWRAVSRVPNGCMIISSSYLIATNDYFKDKNFRAVSIDMVSYAGKDIFLKEFKENQCIFYLKDYRYMDSYVADEFLGDNLTREFIFQEGNIRAFQAWLK